MPKACEDIVCALCSKRVFHGGIIQKGLRGSECTCRTLHTPKDQRILHYFDATFPAGDAAKARPGS